MEAFDIAKKWKQIMQKNPSGEAKSGGVLPKAVSELCQAIGMNSGDLLATDFRSKYNLKAPKDILIGLATKLYLSVVSRRVEEQFYKDVKSFYKAACMYLKTKIFPVSDPLWRHAEVADISVREHAHFSSFEYFDRFSCLLRGRDPTSADSPVILEEEKTTYLDNLQAELCTQSFSLPQYMKSAETAEQQWMLISNIKDCNGAIREIKALCFWFNVPDAMSGEGDGKTFEHSCCKKQFFLGFKECQDEVMRFLVEGEAMSATDPLCLRIIDHLNAAGRHFEVTLSNEEAKIQIEAGGQLNMPSSYHSGSLSNTLLSASTMDPLLPLPANPPTPGIGHACSVQDKHLRNLLSTRGLQEFEPDQEYSPQSQSALPSGSVCCSQINMLGSQTVTLSQVTSHMPDFSGPSLGVEESFCGGIISTESSLNGGVSSGYVSDVSCLEKHQNISANNSGVSSHVISCKENAINIYKFKHNITKRFSQEGKVILQHTYDGSSSTSSRECEEELPGTCALKHRSARGKSRYASTSDSGPYPSSDHSYSHERSKCFNSDVRSINENSGNSGLEERNDRCKNQFCKRSTHSITFTGHQFEKCSRSALPLPGFVLHPSGTHYMPMSVCYSNFPDNFETMETTMGPPVFHPISIPVHFRGPVISFPTKACTRNQSENTEECSKISADPDVKQNEIKDIKCTRK